MKKGEKFNHLIAIEFVVVTKKIHYWRFKCECGKIKVINKYNVLRGHTKSCGCLLNRNKEVDIQGKKFGELTAIEKITTDLWLFECSCGKKKVIIKKNVKNGNTKSCGCMKAKINGDAHRTHGKTGTKVYRAWLHMKDRCNNTNDKEYKRYGARGIAICKEWKSFEQFFEDMGESPKGTSLDRIDNNKIYCKENCKWSTPREQANNRRSNRFITYNGRTETLAEWGRITGINAKNINRRIDNYGWSIEKALTIQL